MSQLIGRVCCKLATSVLHTPKERFRFSRYARTLRKDSEKILFDDTMEDFLLRYARDEHEINSDIEYLNEMGYNQSQKHYSLMEEQIFGTIQDDGSERDSFCGKNHTDNHWLWFVQQGAQTLAERFTTAKLEPLIYDTDQSIMDQFPSKDSHAGFLYFETGKKEKGENSDGILLRVSEYIADRIKGIGKRCMILGYRTQNQSILEADHRTRKPKGTKAKIKTRVIIMVDMLQAAVENIFAKPLMHWMHSESWYAGGQDDAQLGKRIRDLQSRYQYKLVLDYSHYDVSISDWMMRLVAEVAFKAFPNLDEYHQKIWGVVWTDIISKRILMPDGKVYKSIKGNPSGSEFTSFIGTVMNAIMCISYMATLGKVWKKDYDFIAMGDDIYIFSNFEIDRVLFCSFLSEIYGVEANPDKCDWSRKGHPTPEFLSREWRSDGSWRPRTEMVAKALFPERYRDYKSGKTSAPWVFFSYCMTYPSSMYLYFDVRRFQRDYPQCTVRNAMKVLRSKGYRLPGSLDFRLRYADVDVKADDPRGYLL